MPSSNPLSEFQGECLSILQAALKKAFPRVKVAPSLERTRDPKYGEFYSSVGFEIAKQVKKKPEAIADQIVKKTDTSKAKYVKAVKSLGGYVNFFVDHPKFAKLVLKSVTSLDKGYGYVKTEKPLKMIVEHTSANPSGPLHVGTARNSVLGDCLAKMLKARGHSVRTHFYLDDMGRQVATVAYGYVASGKKRPKKMKADDWIGLVYATTSTLLDIRRLKAEVQAVLGKEGMEDKLGALRDELYHNAAIIQELKSRDVELFLNIFNGIEKDEDPEVTISRLIRNYEKGDEKAKKLIMELVQKCVKAFEKTLDDIGIRFDSWDWESSFVWDGSVKKAIDGLKKTPYVAEREGALILNAGKIIKDYGPKERLGIKERFDVPELTLMRSDGTTLYTTRDIAYTIWKLGQAKRVINVIGFDQSLAQIQLKLALRALGYEDIADRLIHFAYELVKLPGMKMARRRGRYVTLDQVIDQAVRLAYKAVSEKSPQLSESKKRKIASFVGLGAVRYALVSVDPTKAVDFVWERVLDFEQNSAPFIQYAHARASNILKRAKVKPTKPDFSSLDHELERRLVLLMARFPNVFIDGCDGLRPSVIADYANELAEVFSSYYASVPVLKAETKGLRDARLMLVESIRITLRNALDLLGIHAPERM